MELITCAGSEGSIASEVRSKSSVSGRTAEGKMSSVGGSSSAWAAFSTVSASIEVSRSGPRRGEEVAMGRRAENKFGILKGRWEDNGNGCRCIGGARWRVQKAESRTGTLVAIATDR